jgi:hypothetical protein
MNTARISPSTVASSSSSIPADSASAPAPVPRGPGRPSGLNGPMLDLLCAVIRETGASDSAAASRAGVHPSTVSRWKRDCPDVAILLRAAREEFRQAQLSVIFAEAAAGHARSWRAAAWLLERIFPEDYSPRAKERALFREQHDAALAQEGEGSELVLPDAPEGEPLQNVQNSRQPASPPPTPASALPSKALQNVKNAHVTPSSKEGTL